MPTSPVGQTGPGGHDSSGGDEAATSPRGMRRVQGQKAQSPYRIRPYEPVPAAVALEQSTG